ncbi:hypothetical protein ANS017_26250 [Paraclostridium bifermentans]|uniref:hypothetical protein n=1 Tax=Paraclostridium bifermentans TaxID=1490 RepID=UPI001FF189E6|nr:hypothetical protein [Paraclostridium bifermentans]UOW66882.1 hypothetical protein MTR78_09995 [Paraclostridium bifermentans]GKZ04054.1 hypothetical protein ANS014_24880 [Paraclostridium bifermentans]GKZ05571.1 hypothetical protein ANS015_04540 [Paraclostridium bifermentans]GKZ11241.1 hypothetical protein ANS017_26250 [Paraclostridium bifermentans]
MNINIGEIVNNKIKEMEENKVVENLIAETIEKSVVKAVSEAIDGYTIKRTIEKKVEKEVCDIVNDIGFTAYNTFIANKVKDITEGTIRKDLEDKIQGTLNGILLNKKENIKLSDLFEMYREHLNSDTDEHEKYELENFVVEIEDNDRGWITYKLSKEKSKYSWDKFDIEFIIHENYNDESNGTIWKVKLDGENVDNSLKLGYRSEFENLLVNLMYNETVIEIDVEDEDDIDTSFDIEY